VKVLGSPIDAIEDTGDRERFRQAMLQADVPPLRSKSANTVNQALDVANEIGYPVMIRVAYTLGGKGTGVAHNAWELKDIVTKGLAKAALAKFLLKSMWDIGKKSNTKYA
jgi:carbamoyl-phosphate synthase large subunit